MTRNVSLFIINDNNSYNNDKNINDNDIDSIKIDINKNLINKISAETVNCDEL